MRPPTSSSDLPGNPDYDFGGSITLRLKKLSTIEREDIEDAPFWKEVVAFTKIPQFRLDRYQGCYVAVYRGDIVDSDTDEAKLALRFYRTFGYVPVYIHNVGVEDALMDVLV